MLRGLSTVSFFADDIMAARNWYAELLGIESYFVRPAAGTPAYVEFGVGDYQDELGIIDRRFARHGRPDQAGRRGHLLARRRRARDLRPADLHGRDGARGADRARTRIRHRVGHRPVREHPRHRVQQALPGGCQEVAGS